MSRISVTIACLVILSSFACESHKAMPQKPGATAGRFVPTGSDPNVALDTKSGRLCRISRAAGNHPDLPMCGQPDVEPRDELEEVDANPEIWERAEIAVTCSGKDKLLPWSPLDANGRKQVILDCELKNLTATPVSLLAPSKVDALLRLRDGRILRVQNVYLGSGEHQISSRGNIHGGLWLGHRYCPSVQSDYDCAQAQLMNASELMLTDTDTGIRYHVTVE
jgi:hypothetical protein